MSKAKCKVTKPGIWLYAGGKRTQAPIGSVIDVAESALKSMRNKVEPLGDLAVATEPEKAKPAPKAK